MKCISKNSQPETWILSTVSIPDLWRSATECSLVHCFYPTAYPWKEMPDILLAFTFTLVPKNTSNAEYRRPRLSNRRNTRSRTDSLLRVCTTVVAPSGKITRQRVQLVSPSPDVTDWRLNDPLKARSQEAREDLLLVTSLRTDTVSSVSHLCSSTLCLLYSNSPRSFDLERFFLCHGSSDLRWRSSASLLLFFNCRIKS